MRKIVPVLVTALAALLCSAAFSQTGAPARPSDFGKREFESNCASCHGNSGKGNGPLVELLRRSPPDLTLLAQRNPKHPAGQVLQMALATGDVVTLDAKGQIEATWQWGEPREVSWVWQQVPQRGWRLFLFGFRHGWLAGLFVFTGTLWWTGHVTLPGMSALCVYLALYPAIWGGFAALLRRAGSTRLLAYSGTRPRLTKGMARRASSDT